MVIESERDLENIPYRENMEKSIVYVEEKTRESASNQNLLELALPGPSGPSAFAPAPREWILAYLVTLCDPMDQSHTLEPAPDPPFQ